MTDVVLVFCFYDPNLIYTFLDVIFLQARREIAGAILLLYYFVKVGGDKKDGEPTEQTH